MSADSNFLRAQTSNVTQTQDEN